MKRNEKKLLRTSVSVVITGMLAVLVIAASFMRLETSMIEVSAQAQDGYVRLVVDQINLNGDRTDEEMVRDILATLDSSSTHYWTFTKGQDILFVKDVLETNKYKGISASTYYQSRSASAFLESLNENSVRHEVITMEGDQYLASGMEFSYQGQSYRLVLLTDRSFILENNTYLGAKITMITLIALVITVMILLPMILAWHYDRLFAEEQEEKEENEKLYRELDAIGREKMNYLLYSEEGNFWNTSLLKDFLAHMQKRGIRTATAAVFHFASVREQDDLIQNGLRFIHLKYLRFMDGDQMILLFPNQDEAAIQKETAPLSKALKEIHTYELEAGSNKEEQV